MKIPYRGTARWVALTGAHRAQLVHNAQLSTSVTAQVAVCGTWLHREHHRQGARVTTTGNAVGGLRNLASPRASSIQLAGDDDGHAASSRRSAEPGLAANIIDRT